MNPILFDGYCTSQVKISFNVEQSFHISEMKLNYQTFMESCDHFPKKSSFKLQGVIYYDVPIVFTQQPS